MKHAIDAAREAFDKGRWSKMIPSERSLIIFRIADIMERNLKHLARLECINQGKPIKLCRDSDFPFGIDNVIDLRNLLADIYNNELHQEYKKRVNTPLEWIEPKSR